MRKKGPFKPRFNRLLILNAFEAFKLVSAGLLDLQVYAGVIMICNLSQSDWEILTAVICKTDKKVFPRIKKMRDEIERLAGLDQVVYLKIKTGNGNQVRIEFTNHDAIDLLMRHGWYDRHKPSIFPNGEQMPPWDDGRHLAERLKKLAYQIDII